VKVWVSVFELVSVTWSSKVWSPSCVEDGIQLTRPVVAWTVAPVGADNNTNVWASPWSGSTTRGA
jgi:hypothetical protein